MKIIYVLNLNSICFVIFICFKFSSSCFSSTPSSNELLIIIKLSNKYRVGNMGRVLWIIPFLPQLFGGLGCTI